MQYCSAQGLLFGRFIVDVFMVALVQKGSTPATRKGGEEIAPDGTRLSMQQAGYMLSRVEVTQAGV